MFDNIIVLTAIALIILILVLELFKIRIFKSDFDKYIEKRNKDGKRDVK